MWLEYDDAESREYWNRKVKGKKRKDSEMAIYYF
jgi:hypothetical protein